MVKDFQTMLNIVSSKDKTQQIVDARPRNLFSGELFFCLQLFLYCTVSGEKGGHLPDSLNVSYNDVFDQDNQCLKSEEELQQRKITVHYHSCISRFFS